MENQEEDNNNELQEWLTEKMKELKKPLRVSNSVAELAVMYSDSNVSKLKREVRDVSKNSYDWTLKKDADLIALSYYHANINASMRSIETYRRIAECWKSGDPPEPKQLFVRIKYLCSEENLNYMRQLSGLDNVKDDAEKKNKINDAVAKLRAAVLDIEDIDRYNLMDRVELCINERPHEREKRSWINEARKISIIEPSQIQGSSSSRLTKNTYIILD